MNRACRTTFIAFALMLILPLPASANLITNGDFEAGNTGFTTGYRFVSPPGLSEYTLTTDPHSVTTGAWSSYGDHTTGSGNMMMVNGNGPVILDVWSQTVAAIAGRNYQFDMYMSSWTPTPALLDVLVNGSSIGTFSAPTATGIWKLASAQFNSGTNSSLTVTIQDLNQVGSGNDFALDDLSITAVPEPSSFVLSGLGIAGFFFRRRNTGSSRQNSSTS